MSIAAAGGATGWAAAAAGGATVHVLLWRERGRRRCGGEAARETAALRASVRMAGPPDRRWVIMCASVMDGDASTVMTEILCVVRSGAAKIIKRSGAANLPSTVCGFFGGGTTEPYAFVQGTVLLPGGRSGLPTEHPRTGEREQQGSAARGSVRGGARRRRRRRQQGCARRRCMAGIPWSKAEVHGWYALESCGLPRRRDW